MSSTNNTIEDKLYLISKQLESLERRINTLELELGLHAARKTRTTSDLLMKDDATQLQSGESISSSKLESRFGEFGLAWIGNIVLLLGVSFLVQYIQKLGYNYLAVSLGYLSVAGVFFLSHLFKTSYAHLARMFNYTAQVLLFYFTLRLHFFTTDPIITQKAIVLFLLLLIVAFQIFFAIRRKSAVIAGLAFIMILSISIMSDSTHLFLSLTTITAAMAIFLFHRFGWWNLLIFSIFLVYLTFLFWLINNPIMGHPVKIIDSHQYGFIYLFAIGIIYSLPALEIKKSQFSENIIIGEIIFNGLMFTSLLLFFVLSFFRSNFIILFSIIAIFSIVYSVALKFRADSKFTPAFYALYGFLALSIAVYGIYDFPRMFWLLSLQSLLVVSMALWFRNKIIVLMNSMLFVLLAGVYLASSTPVNEVNFSFALVALATARILNWKKDSLEIKTDLIRNTYLILAFIMVLYAVFHVVSGNFVTLSWTITAVIFFILSIILKNAKYRYMALGSMIATVFYLFVVDLAKVEIVYRVLAFLFLALISIIISIYYARRVKKMKEQDQ